jgi:uncharacterized repeat protein (TIGR03803 family)
MRNFDFTGRLRARLVLALISAFIVLTTQAAHTQTFSVLHSFTGGGDGNVSYAGLTVDVAGNLYGTTIYGGVTGGSCGSQGCGTVFKLTHRGAAWTLNPIYTFSGGSDGAFPAARVMIGPDGALYGTTAGGGSAPSSSGGGVAFRLQPPARISARILNPWIETVVYQFASYSGDGAQPYYGDLLFDQAGNIYGTTFTGGFECADASYCGTVYKLTRNGNAWTETILYAFPQSGVAYPQAGVIFDPAGNLYGTTTDGNGAVFQLTPSGTGWTENTIYDFSGGLDGSLSIGGLIRDPSGNFFGGTASGGTNGAGTVYELTPSGGGWTENVIYNFTGTDYGPVSALVRDAAGNLYGTTCEGGSHRNGSVFKLTPSGGTWTETDLYVFTGGNDGSCPWGGVTRDADGNLYGTTLGGGPHSAGVVFEITP